jgi:hypothetical protein
MNISDNVLELYAYTDLAVKTNRLLNAPKSCPIVPSNEFEAAFLNVDSSIDALITEKYITKKALKT